MNPAQRLALRALVQKLLPEFGQEGLLELLYSRMAGTAHSSALADPSLEALWAQPETLGWAYQYAREQEKQQVFERLLKQGEKVPDWAISAATQLFTPAWIVRFLVENSLGRLWLEMHPDSRLRDDLPYLLPVVPAALPASAGDLPERAREILVLDPACGAMHFGLGAYDLLVRCYEEELSRAGQPGWPETPSVATPAEIPAAVLSENLYGVDIDPDVLAVARRAIRLKAGIEPANLICAPAPLGALDREVHADRRFHVVLTNPPYMARKNAGPALAAHLEQGYPEGKGDLYTAFLQRCMEWLAPGGRLGVIAQSSFMFIGSYEPLRRWLLERGCLESMAHLGSGAFVEIVGEKVNTAAFVMRREDGPNQRGEAMGYYLRLLDGGEEEKQANLEVALRAANNTGATTASGDGLVYYTSQTVFRDLPGLPWIYWLPSELRSRYTQGERVAEHVRFCRGITTADNRRFVRYWWEVGLEGIDFGCESTEQAARSERRWFPYMKGGGPVRWFGNILHVLNWADGGKELRAFSRAAVRNLPFQFREGVTYSSVTGGSVAARRMAPGFLFDQASNALFPHDPADWPLLMALLNHPIAAFTVGFNPTVNIVEADLNRIPWPQADRAEVTGRVEGCIELARRIDQMSELSPYFRQPPLPDQGDLAGLIRRLAEQEAALERTIDEGLGLSRSGRAAIRHGVQAIRPTLFAEHELVEAWVSYGMGILLGRCTPGGYGGGALLSERWDQVSPLVRGSRGIALDQAPGAVRQILSILLGEEGLRRLAISHMGPYLSQGFLRRHARTYKGRPVFTVRDGAFRWGCEQPEPL